MSKAECNVVRDLMPLCIDGAASEESQRMVTEHVAGCETCAEAYGEMQTVLPQMSAQKENAALEHAAKTLHTKRKIRTLWAIIMSMAALMIALIANAGEVAAFMDDAWFQLRYVGRNDELRLDAFNVELQIEYYHDKWDGVSLNTRVESSPCGNRPFRPDFQLRYDEMTGQGYIQLRLIAVEEEEENWYDEGEISLSYLDIYGFDLYDLNYSRKSQTLYYYTNVNNGVYSEPVDVYWLELVSGDDVEVLWKSGDGFPAIWHAGELTKASEPAPTLTPRPTATPEPVTPKPTMLPLPPDKR